MMTPAVAGSERRRKISLLLVIVTAAAFAPVLIAGFTNCDDPQYVTDNPPVRAGLAGGSIVWAFTTLHANNWHPLTWLSHMLDVQLFGLHPAGHHLTSLLLHLANALLLALLLQRLTGASWPSWGVAALFALHPLHVESVAWVAERKNVLSAFFWLLTIWCYARYVERPSRGAYLLALACFLGGLLAKPMVVSLPFVLLLLDFWPQGRWRGLIPPPAGGKRRPALPAWRLVLEKLPLLAAAGVASAVTLHAQRQVISLYSPPLRLGNALCSYGAYVAKTIWPAGLAV